MLLLHQNCCVCFVKLFQKSGFWSLLCEFPWKKKGRVLWFKSFFSEFTLFYTIRIRLLCQGYHFSLLICYSYLFIFSILHYLHSLSSSIVLLFYCSVSFPVLVIYVLSLPHVLLISDVLCSSDLFLLIFWFLLLLYSPFLMSCFFVIPSSFNMFSILLMFCCFNFTIFTFSKLLMVLLSCCPVSFCCSNGRLCSCCIAFYSVILLLSNVLFSLIHCVEILFLSAVFFPLSHVPYLCVNLLFQHVLYSCDVLLFWCSIVFSFSCSVSFTCTDILYCCSITFWCSEFTLHSDVILLLYYVLCSSDSLC